MNGLNRVDIRIRKADQKRFELLCSDFDDRFESRAFPRSIKLVEYRFYQRSSELLGFEFLLQANKIPYDKCWEFQGQYDGGAEYHRIDQQGQSVVKCFSEPEVSPLSSKAKPEEEGNPLQRYLACQQQTYELISWAEQQAILEQRASAE